MKRYMLAAIAAVVGVGSFAQAATVFNTDVVSWTVGTGQSNGNFIVSTLNSIELGLRAQTRNVGAIADANLDGIYIALPGISNGVDNAKWNFDWSADLRNNAAVTGLTLRVDSDPGVGTLFTDFVLPTTGLQQGSSNMGFFAPAVVNTLTFSFDPNVAGLYDFQLIATGTGNAVLNSVSMQVQVIPLPLASTAGMALVGMMGLRRRA